MTQDVTSKVKETAKNCVGRGCVRACMDHLEKAGRIEKQYRTPMIEGEQWVIEGPNV